VLLDRFAAVVRERGEHPAITDDRETVSFATLGDHVARVAGAIQARGLAGRRVAMLVPQGARWVASFLGVIAGGATVVPLSPLHPAPEQAWFVEASQSAAVVTATELPFTSAVPHLDIDGLRATPLAPVTAPPAEAALILYTSGTTGKPKGALLSQSNLAAISRLLAAAWQWSPDDVLLHCLPLHHLHGLGIALFPSLLAGGATRMVDRFDALRLWEEMAHATVLMGVPTMHKRMLDAYDAADAATQARWARHAAALRLVTSGSAALPTTLGEKWRALTGRYPLERFGMTEIGVGATNPVDGERLPGTCGPTLPGMETRIVAESGAEAAPGEPGELWIRGPSVFLGYDGNPAATSAAFVGDWFKSGDTATYVGAGYVKILGRTSIDILKSGGYKLSALEIEEVLREHPAVADVAVVGLPDETWGEIAVAAVIARAPLTPEELREWAKAKIAPYKVPKRVVLLDAFPRNAVGKVIKPELARDLRQRGAGT
jgi:malonyl-CoA/methylmalonyl-CoA synthetase